MPSSDETAEQQIVTKAFALVGTVATGFSTIEFHLQFLLSTLICGKENAPEAMLVLKQKQFGQRIELLKDLVTLKLPKDSELRRKGVELVAALNTLRETRNLYVHGYWLINYPVILSSGGIRCSETKWRFNKDDESWTSMTTRDISLDDLRKQITETDSVFGQIHALIKQIHEQLLVPKQTNCGRITM
jgi:hypothetical protein